MKAVNDVVKGLIIFAGDLIFLAKACSDSHELKAYKRFACIANELRRG